MLAAPGSCGVRVASESIRRTANSRNRKRDDSSYRSVVLTAVHCIMELAMMNPFKLFPEPQAVRLSHICIAQVVVCASALTSNAVLLSKIVPTLISGFN